MCIRDRAEPAQTIYVTTGLKDWASPARDGALRARGPLIPPARGADQIGNPRELEAALLRELRAARGAKFAQERRLELARIAYLVGASGRWYERPASPKGAVAGRTSPVFQSGSNIDGLRRLGLHSPAGGSRDGLVDYRRLRLGGTTAPASCTAHGLAAASFRRGRGSGRPPHRRRLLFRRPRASRDHGRVLPRAAHPAGPFGA